ncbi:MAG: insulinase family protein [Vicingaceae bacterium]
MKKIFLNIVLTLLASSLLAQVDRSEMPEAGPAPKIDLGETQSFTLDNGLKVFVVENHKLPQVAFSLQLDIDPVKEGDKAGAADIAGDLLAKGTETMSKEDLNFAVDFIGARFFTSATSVYGASLKKHQTKLLEIMSDVVINADFKEEELEKLKTQYISGIQTEKDDPDAIARNVQRVLLYGKDHPYGEITTEETISNINLQDAKSFYNKYFKPNVAYLAVVGDINLEEAKPLIKKYFGDWKKGEVPTFDYPMPEQPSAMQIAFVNKPGAVQSVVSTFNTIELEPGSEDVIGASVANGILGGGFVSKLNLNLREEHSYTYGARSSIDSDELVGSFSASAKVRNEVTDSALNEMMNEIMAMRKGEITEDELQTIKNYRTGTFAIGLENPQTKARFAINTEKYDLPEDYYNNYLKNLAAVTLEDVKAISKKYINPMSGYVLIVGNQEEVADKIKAFSPTGTIQFYDTYGNEAAETTLMDAPEGVTAEKVIEDYIAALGGEKKLKKVESISMDMSASMQGTPFNLNVVNVNGEKLLQTVQVNGMVVQKTVYNGETGQTSSPQGKTMMSEEELADMKFETVIFPELLYNTEDYSIELLGIDTKNDEKVYVVEITKPNGEKQKDYFSVDSHLEVASETTQETPQGDMVMQRSFSDYKEVKGIMFPHTIVEPMGPQSLSTKVEVIELNPKIDDSMFAIEE